MRLAAEILALRAERAQLLGYADFAAYKLEPEMAKTPEAVRDLLMRVWQPARAKALADAGVLEAMLKGRWLSGAAGAWDWRYYSEKRRKAEHDLDEAALKPYLGLEAMLGAHVRLRKPPFRAGIPRDRGAVLSPGRPGLGGYPGG